MRRYLDYSDMGPWHTMVERAGPAVEMVRRRIAAAAGCDPEEIAITRNSSEALENRAVRRSICASGDEVLTTNQDYPRMLTTFQQRERREGIVLKRFLSRCRRPAWTTCTSGSSGRHAANQVDPGLPHHQPHRADFPGARGSARWRTRATFPVIVDGAHAFSQFPFKISDLDCDYYGSEPAQMDLCADRHGLPVRRKSRIASTWSLMAADARQDDDIRKFEEIGTHPAANHNAITEALIFNENMGIDRKAARLRYLRDRWATALGSHRQIQILHNPAPEMSCGIGIRDPRWRPGRLGAHARIQVQHFHFAHGPHRVHRLAHYAQCLHHDPRYRLLHPRGGGGTESRLARGLAYAPLIAFVSAPALCPRPVFSHRDGYLKGYVVGAKLPPSGIFVKSAGGEWRHVGFNHPSINALDFDPARTLHGLRSRRQRTD